MPASLLKIKAVNFNFETCGPIAQPEVLNLSVSMLTSDSPVPSLLFYVVESTYNPLTVTAEVL